MNHHWRGRGEGATEASNSSLEVATLSPVVYNYGNLLALMCLKAVFHKMLSVLPAHRRKLNVARKENIPRIIPTALQKAVKYIGVIFSQLVSCHLGISLERYSLKDSVWNSLISVTKHFLCLPFPVPLDLYSQEFYWEYAYLAQ